MKTEVVPLFCRNRVALSLRSIQLGSSHWQTNCLISKRCTTPPRILTSSCYTSCRKLVSTSHWPSAPAILVTRAPLSSSAWENLKLPSTRHEYQQLFAKAIEGFSSSPNINVFYMAPSSSASVGQSGLTSSDRETLRVALDTFIALPHSSEVRTPALVREACEISLAAGWSQRCCEVFFSSFPPEYLQQCRAALNPGPQEHCGTEQRRSSSGIHEDKIHHTLMQDYPLTPAFLDLLNALPSCLFQAALAFYQPSKANGSPDHPDDSHRYLNQCVALIRYLVRNAPAANALSVQRFVNARHCGSIGEKRACGASLAMRLYFHTVWELLLEEMRCEKAKMERRSMRRNSASGRGVVSSTAAVSALIQKDDEEELLSQTRVSRLREVAMDAAQFFGIRLSRHRGVSAHPVQDGLGDRPEMDLLNDIIDASLRLLRYRWVSILGGAASDASAGGPSAHPHPLQYPDPSSLPPRVAHKLFQDAMATVYTHLMRLFIQQEERIVAAEQHSFRFQRGRRVSVPVHPTPVSILALRERYVLHPEVYALIMRSSVSARRWDIAEYVSLLMDQYWHTRCGGSAMMVTQGVVTAGPQHSSVGDGVGVGSTTSQSVVSVTIQKVEEELVLQQLRFLLFSRQGNRALSWWGWLSALTTVPNNSGGGNSHGSSSPGAASATSIYPVPSIPVVTTLARAAGEFSTTNDYHVQSFRRDRTTTLHHGGGEATVRPLSLPQDPSAIALWCLEMMLHIQQPTPPSGDALFLGVSACAKAGLPELDEVLRSLLVNDVVSLTEEEVQHIRLLHCRRDVHWRERLDSLVPLLQQIPPLFLTSSGQEVGGRKTITNRKTKKRENGDPRWSGLTSGKLNTTTSTDSRAALSNTPASISSPRIDSVRCSSFLRHVDFLPPHPPHGHHVLSERNTFRTLVLLQEGNDARFLPFYLYMLDYYSSASSNSAPLSPDQECRWLLLALVYCASNSQILPREWVWRVAAEAMKHLQLQRGRTISPALSERDILEKEENPDIDNDAGSEDADQISVDEVVGSETEEQTDSIGSAVPNHMDSVLATKREATSGLSIHPAVAPDTWYSLRTKWKMLYSQYTQSFWDAFLSAVAHPAVPPPSSEGKGVRSNESTGEPQRWSRLLELPHGALDHSFCQRSLEFEERQRMDVFGQNWNASNRGIFRFLQSKRRGKAKFLAPDAFPTAPALFARGTPPQGIGLNLLLRRVKSSPTEAPPPLVEISTDDQETLGSKIRLEWQERVLGRW